MVERREQGAKTEPMVQRAEVKSGIWRLEAETEDPHTYAGPRWIRITLVDQTENELREWQEPVETSNKQILEEERCCWIAYLVRCILRLRLIGLVTSSCTGLCVSVGLGSLSAVDSGKRFMQCGDGWLDQEWGS